MQSETEYLFKKKRPLRIMKTLVVKRAAVKVTYVRYCKIIQHGRQVELSIHFVDFIEMIENVKHIRYTHIKWLCRHRHQQKTQVKFFNTIFISFGNRAMVIEFHYAHMLILFCHGR